MLTRLKANAIVAAVAVGFLAVAVTLVGTPAADAIRVLVPQPGGPVSDIETDDLGDDADLEGLRHETERLYIASGKQNALALQAVIKLDAELDRRAKVRASKKEVEEHRLPQPIPLGHDPHAFIEDGDEPDSDDPDVPELDDPIMDACEDWVDSTATPPGSPRRNKAMLQDERTLCVRWEAKRLIPRLSASTFTTFHWSPDPMASPRTRTQAAPLEAQAAFNEEDINAAIAQSLKNDEDDALAAAIAASLEIAAPRQAGRQDKDCDREKWRECEK